MKRTALVALALIGLVGCRQTGKRWLASPAQQFGVPDGEMHCFDDGPGGPDTKEWHAHYERDGYYWCYEKDRPAEHPAGGQSSGSTKGEGL